jgi:hypothetical protein
MHERRPPARVSLVYITPRGKGCAYCFDAVLFVSDGVAFVNSVDYWKSLLSGRCHRAEEGCSDEGSGAEFAGDTHSRD